jgi:hypothetical protein
MGSVDLFSGYIISTVLPILSNMYFLLELRIRYIPRSTTTRNLNEKLFAFNCMHLCNRCNYKLSYVNAHYYRRKPNILSFYWNDSVPSALVAISESAIVATIVVGWSIKSRSERHTLWCSTWASRCSRWEQLLALPVTLALNIFTFLFRCFSFFFGFSIPWASPADFVVIHALKTALATIFWKSLNSRIKIGCGQQW